MDVANDDDYQAEKEDDLTDDRIGYKESIGYYVKSEPWTEKQKKYNDKSESALARIKTGKDLRDFIWILLEGIDIDFYEEQDVEDYVEGAYGVLEGTPDAVLERERPDWKMVGDLFLRAFYHS